VQQAARAKTNAVACFTLIVRIVAV
jgi:hypothetical protein